MTNFKHKEARANFSYKSFYLPFFKETSHHFLVSFFLDSFFSFLYCLLFSTQYLFLSIRLTGNNKCSAVQCSTHTRAHARERWWSARACTHTSALLSLRDDGKFGNSSTPPFLHTNVIVLYYN